MADIGARGTSLGSVELARSPDQRRTQRRVCFRRGTQIQDAESNSKNLIMFMLNLGTPILNKLACHNSNKIDVFNLDVAMFSNNLKGIFLLISLYTILSNTGDIIVRCAHVLCTISLLYKALFLGRCVSPFKFPFCTKKIR